MVILLAIPGVHTWKLLFTQRRGQDMMQKRSLSILLAVLMLLTIATPAMATTLERDPVDFVDMPFWDNGVVIDIHDSQEFAESSEVCDFSQGRDALAIEPMNVNLTTSRGRAAFYLVMGRDPSLLWNGNLPGSRFPDVHANDWAFPAITWATLSRMGERAWRWNFHSGAQCLPARICHYAS